MHRTQIYLNDTLYETLKARAYGDGISMSEMIRRTLEKELADNSVFNARTFFDRLRPLESFADSTVAYVRGIRSGSRLLRNTGKR